MRMYSMYFICKSYIEKVMELRVESRNANGSTVYYLNHWREKAIILNELAKIDPLKERVRRILDTVPIAYRDFDKFDVTQNLKREYENGMKELVVSMQTIIDAYEMMGIKADTEGANGFDVKLPKFESVGEFAKCLDDLDFIITQCPYLKNDDEQIKYNSVDVGSTWLTFLVIGASTGILLHNLSKLVDMAVKIKSHITTVRMQEEALRSIQIKNDIAAEVFKTFEEVNRVMLNQCIGDLKNELGELKDGEEEGKAQKSLEKLAYWMDKGLQVYSSIDAPREVRDLFPCQDDVSFITDDLQKLIEMNGE